MESWSQERIAEALKNKKVITEMQRQEVMRIHRETGKKVTLIIYEKKMASDSKININLAQLQVNDLDSYLLKGDLLEKFKEEIGRASCRERV